MKRNFIGILSLVVMSLMINVPANAQQSAKAKVPFAFKVGSKQLPAGTYRISPAGANAIAIQNFDARTGALTTGRHESPRNTGAKLVFHCVAGQYFLAEIWRGSDSTGIVLPTSSQEKALRKEVQSASNQSNVSSEEVMIALN